MCPIVFFNWNKLCSEKFNNIISIVRKLPTNSLLREKYDGNSFLLKPHILWERKPTLHEAIEVLQIASTRNHFNYWLSGFKGAYLDFCGVQKEKLIHNRFVTINDKDRLIYIKTEE